MFLILSWMNYNICIRWGIISIILNRGQFSLAIFFSARSAVFTFFKQRLKIITRVWNQGENFDLLEKCSTERPTDRTLHLQDNRNLLGKATPQPIAFESLNTN